MRPDLHRRWRWRLKAGLAYAIAGAFGDRAAAHRAGGCRPLVLGYHRVVEDYEQSARTEMPSMLISTAMFERHLDWVGRHFRFVDLDTIGEHARRNTPFPEPVAAVTFDDGYADVHELAAPILKRKGIPAAVFVVTDLVGRPSLQVHDRLYYLLAKGYATWDHPRRQLLGVLTDLGLPASDLLGPRATTSTPMKTISTLLPSLPRYDVQRVMEYLEMSVGNGFAPAKSLDWPALRRMREDGFTIGSHTRTHVSLPMESADTAVTELEGSKRMLEEQLGGPIAHFAYPGGEFTPGVVESLVRAGYSYGYTACPHGDRYHPELTIERLLLWEGSSIDAAGHFSPAILGCQVNDLWPPARRCSRVHHA